MQFEVWAQTDVGLKREINQDSILVDHELSLFVVADGMGGHKGGEVASALAVETTQDYIRSRLQMGAKIVPKHLISEAYREASRRIHHKSTKESPELMGMGTTMVLVFAHNRRVYIGNVGDSRAYLIRGQNLWQLTEDHSLVNEQIKAGVIREEDAGEVVGRNVITRSVGFEEDVVVDVLERELNLEDSFLLCSDGLSGLVAEDKLADMCRKLSGKELVAKCVEEAKRAGGDDNISTILIKVKSL